MKIPVVLTVAGSDSGGGAGIQADLKTFFACGVHGTCAVTSVTSQNTMGVSARFDVPPETVVSQMEAVLSDIKVRAVKTGMLALPETVEAVAEVLAARSVPDLVVDPVLASSGGFSLLDGGLDSLADKLLPLAAVFTPNLEEASVLLGCRLNDVGDMRKAAEKLRKLGPRCVVVKGGHLPHPRPPVDVYYDGERMVELEGRRVDTENDHGTGCVFSAAVAAFLALGRDMLEAVKEAKTVVEEALRCSLELGGGRGPVHPVVRRGPIKRGR
jgi:hydroxymethylpyrimidine/phosphomethylpyrimidine kinase